MFSNGTQPQAQATHPEMTQGYYRQPQVQTPVQSPSSIEQIVQMHNEALITNTRDVQALGQHINTINGAIQELATNQKNWNEYLQNQAKTAQIKADQATTRASIGLVLVVLFGTIGIADLVFTRFAPDRQPPIQRSK